MERESVLEVRVGDEERRLLPLRLDSLEADNDYLTKGDVFAPDMIEAYIELKREEQMAFETSPHPIEYKMYYSV